MSDSFVLPDRFDEFRVVRPLGEGTMGAVYLCTDTVLYRRVAVKFLKGVEMDEGMRDRFLNEARAIAQLSHPNVVTLYRVGQVGTIPYLASEYIEGKSLDRLELPVDTQLLWQVALGIAQGLAAAHRQGILHRDMKPANIIVTHAGEVKLLDFGLAKFLDSLPTDSVLLRSGSQVGNKQGKTTSRRISLRGLALADTPVSPVAAPDEKPEPAARGPKAMSEQCLGTPLYMAPEVWRGERASPATDIYSVGAVLYELASGQVPFDDDDLARLRESALHGEFRPLLDIAPNVPPGMAQIIERCLRRNAAMRFISGEALLAALDTWARSNGGLASSSVSSRTSQHSHSAISEDRLPEGQRPRRGKLLAGAAGVVFCAAAAFTAYRLWPVGGMATLPAGSFLIGSTADEVESAQSWCRQISGAECDETVQKTFTREQPQHRVSLSRFQLDRHEVTNDEFASWLNAQSNITVTQERYVLQSGKMLADLYPMYQPFGGLIYEAARRRFRAADSFSRRPVTQVSWHAANAYCTSRGQSLPTEAQWEYAARGTDGRRFPWGFTEPYCSGTAFARSPGMACASYAVGPSDVATSTQDRTEDGIYDLAGNVAEWVADVYTSQYADCKEPCRDPANLDGSEAGPLLRVVRGGTWLWSAVSVRAATRSRFEQDKALINVGFRCAAPLP